MQKMMSVRYEAERCIIGKAELCIIGKASFALDARKFVNYFYPFRHVFALHYSLLGPFIGVIDAIVVWYDCCVQAASYAGKVRRKIKVTIPLHASYHRSRHSQSWGNGVSE